MKNFSHGGDIYSRNVDHDFSANVNPLGMPKNVKLILSLKTDDFENYPDPYCSALTKKIAAHEGTAEGRIVCGNGAADIIYRIAQAFRPKKALIAVPTFSEYEKALLSVGCEIRFHYLGEENEFEVGEDILGSIDGNEMMFLCDPNNPTGKTVAPDIMEKIVQKCSESGCVLILDRCFMDFAAEKTKYSLKTDENVIVIKAFTKIYAMAGLRLGYAVCPDEKTAEKLRNTGQCWSVSVPAQIAGEAALAEREYVAETVRLIAAEREFLGEKLRNFGFKVFEAKANFILFRCSLPLDDLLMKKGIAIRRCDNFRGLETGYFRIAVRTHEENLILVNAIEEVVKNG